MTDQYKAPEQSKYGNASISQRLADGVYMITANALIKVVMVAQRLSEKLLSVPAKERGELDGEYLSFPNEKASIPMFELAQKGKIKSFCKARADMIRDVQTLVAEEQVQPEQFMTAEQDAEVEIG